MIDDELAWAEIPPDDLWILDKLILAKHLEYLCGPVGVDVPTPGNYIVRPCVNALGFGVGAEKLWIDKNTDHLPPGYFWSEIFEGRHLSVDYEYGEQVLCVEGFKNKTAPEWRWNKWIKTEDEMLLPQILYSIAVRYPKFNVEYIGGKIVECHFRGNPDFNIFPDTQEVIPIWYDEPIIPRKGYRIIPDPWFNTLKLRKALAIRQKQNCPRPIA